MFRVEKIENGYLLHTEHNLETFFKNEKKLVTGIRTLLGLKPVGRPSKKAAD